ncbi:MAG: mucoidy inhibitor MuiA family protein [Cyclobacteriaceae bacterium]|nr:mucoidy inhibitor MuiA family protein [Cyclobacteriaceae bacterium HetDA_MAG_MS6]
MLKITFSLLSVLSTLFIRAESIPTDAAEVTVFLNQAQVTRVAKATVLKGSQTLVFQGVSNRLDQNTLQVRAKGNIVILGVSFRNNYLNEEDLPEALQDLKTQIEDVEAEIGLLDNDAAALQAESDLLSTNKAIKGDQSNLTVAQLQAMANYFRNRTSQIGKEKIDIKRKRTVLQKDLQRLKKQFQDRSNLYRQNLGEILVDVIASETASSEFELSYIVNGASWRPSYDIRVENIKQPATLAYRAVVSQQTGEDWVDVKFTFSTRNPRIGGVKPELYPWYIDFRQPIAQNMRMEKRTLAAPMTESMMIDQEDIILEEAESLADYVVVENTELNTEYKVELPYSLASGAKPLTVPIRDQQVEMNFNHFVVPKLSSYAYLTGKVENWENLDLIAGPANVYFQGAYTGKSYLDPGQAQSGLFISLGVDEGIKVARKKVKDFTARQTIGSNVKETFGYELVMRNNKKSRVDLVIEEQIPISSNKSIMVDPQELSEGNLVGKTGKITWERSLDPGQSLNLKYRFEVKYPKDETISGL